MQIKSLEPVVSWGDLNNVDEITMMEKELTENEDVKEGNEQETEPLPDDYWLRYNDFDN